MIRTLIEIFHKGHANLFEANRFVLQDSDFHKTKIVLFGYIYVSMA